MVATIALSVAGCKGSTDGSLPSDDTINGPSGTVAPGQLGAIEGDPAAADEIDPCSLATREEVEQILGQTVNDVWRNFHPTLNCEYFADEPSFGSATIRIDLGLSQEDFQGQVDFAAQFGDAGAEEVSGIGNTAFAVGPILYVYTGDTALILAVITEESPNLDAAKQLASTALRRLS